jgi:hypothetical protein
MERLDVPFDNLEPVVVRMVGLAGVHMVFVVVLVD